MNSTISQDRLIANRANAQKSTGPRTQAGKLRSRMNALKHGLRSPQPIRLPSDDPSFLETFHQALFEELDPKTPLQLFQFEQLFNAACTIRRVQQLIGLSLYACTLSNEELKKRGIPSLPPAILDRYHRAAQTLFSRALKALQSPPQPNEPSAPNEPNQVTVKATETTPTQAPIAQLLSAGAAGANEPIAPNEPIQPPKTGASATLCVPAQSPIAQLLAAGANEANDDVTPEPIVTSEEGSSVLKEADSVPSACSASPVFSFTGAASVPMGPRRPPAVKIDGYCLSSSNGCGSPGFRGSQRMP